MIELILLIAGIVLLIKGNVKATATSEIPKGAGRVLGIVLMAPFVVNFLVGFLGQLSESARTNLQYAEYIAVALALLIVIVFFRKPTSSY